MRDGGDPLEEPSLCCDCRLVAGTLVVAVRGELDLWSSDELVRALGGPLPPSCRAVELDLASLTFLDCAGARALVECADRARAGGVAFAVRNVPRIARVVLEVGRFDGLLGSGTVDDASR